MPHAIFYGGVISEGPIFGFNISLQVGPQYGKNFLVRPVGVQTIDVDCLVTWSDRSSPDCGPIRHCVGYVYEFVYIPLCYDESPVSAYADHVFDVPLTQTQADSIFYGLVRVNNPVLGPGQIHNHPSLKDDIHGV